MSSAIATAVARYQDQRTSHWRYSEMLGDPEVSMIEKELAGAPIVDVSAIHEKIRVEGAPLYVKGAARSPWPAVFFGMERDGLVLLYAASANDYKDAPPVEAWESEILHGDDWDAVGSAMYGVIIACTPSALEILTTSCFAFDHDGIMLDAFYEVKSEVLAERWEQGGSDIITHAMGTVTHALEFLNCRNVEIVEPKRSRAERRRIERTGKKVSVINVFGAGKSYRSKGSSEPSDEGVPLTSVRGHFAEYGPKYGKGKLFGKIEGRFWIPQHARGTGDEPVKQEFKIILE